MYTEETDDDRVTEQPPPVWEPIKPARSHLNYWVRSTDRRFSRCMGRLLSEAGIIASEWAALRELYRPGRMSPVALGLTIGMSKGGASKLVSRLVAKGLAVKETADFDRRFRAVGLTQQGKELVVLIASIERDADREFFAPLGNGRRFRLTQWLPRLLDSGRSRHVDRWVSAQLKQRPFTRIDPEARSKAAARAQAEADALWAHCMRLAEAAALGTKPPSFPDCSVRPS